MSKTGVIQVLGNIVDTLKFRLYTKSPPILEILRFRFSVFGRRTIPWPFSDMDQFLAEVLGSDRMLNAFGIVWEEPLQKVKAAVFDNDPKWRQKKETSGHYFHRKSEIGAYEFESEAAFYDDPPVLNSIHVVITKVDGADIERDAKVSHRRFLIGLRTVFEKMMGGKSLVKWSLATIFKPFYPFFQETWLLGRTEVKLAAATNYSGGVRVSIWLRSRIHEMRYLEKYGEGEK